MEAEKQASSPVGEAEAIYASLVADYPRAQYHCAEFLVGYLADCSLTFQGDLQQVLILALIGQMHLRSCTDEEPDGIIWRTSATVDTSISASRLSDVTGIPRQTVRRKLLALQKRGWIEQNDAGRWHIVVDALGVPEARRDLVDLNDRSLARFARLYAALRRIA